MANTRELRRRIKSVKNTSQITKAMQMVAATKMRRAQNQAFLGRPYNETLNHTLSKLIQKLEEGSHPLLKENDSKNVGMILFSTDKSLCGALNTNLFRAVLNFSPNVIARHPKQSTSGDNPSEIATLSSKARNDGKNDVQIYTTGKKGRDFVVRTGKDLIADFENTEIVTFRQAVQISKLIIKSFLAGELGEVYLAYPDFVSTIRQEPKIVRLLPVDPNVIAREKVQWTFESEAIQTEKQSKLDRHAGAHDDESSEFLFEPNVDELLEYILVHSIETKIYQAMLETKASEHSARMMAMQNATDNAKELVSDLELSYNQIRQESITRELLEITSASAALE